MFAYLIYRNIYKREYSNYLTFNNLIAYINKMDNNIFKYFFARCIMMKVTFTEIEAKLIKKWFDQETAGHFGDGDFTIGEEQSILDKIKIKSNNHTSHIECSFNLTELEILNIWSKRAFGLFEENKLKKKLSEALEKEKKEFDKSFKKKSS